MKDAVAYSEPKILLPLTSKSASFNTEEFPVNNNPNIQITLNAISSTNLICVASIQGSLDGSTWFDLNSTQATITTDDDILWTISLVDSLMYLRVAVSVSSGSSIFYIQYRGC